MNYSTGGETAGKGSQLSERLAPQVGLEPTTLRLTAGCSAIELLRSVATRSFPKHNIIAVAAGTNAIAQTISLRLVLLCIPEPVWRLNCCLRETITDRCVVDGRRPECAQCNMKI